MLVEQQQQTHLVRAHRKFEPCVGQLHIGLAQTQFPVQLARIVKLGLVKLGETIHCVIKLFRQVDNKLILFSLIIGPIARRQNFSVEFEHLLVGVMAQEIPLELASHLF